jgi:hypothetical protein
MFSQGRQHTGEDLQAQIFFVAQSVGTALDDPALVVQALDESEGNLVRGLAGRSDSVPMALNQLGELFVGLQPLPFEGSAPVLEDAPCPALALGAPELAAGLREQGGRVHALGGGQQGLQCLAAFQGEIFTAREQRGLLPLAEAAVFAREPPICALAHLVQRLPPVAEEVELVKQKRGLRGVGVGRVPKGLPPVPHRQLKPCALFLAQPGRELRQAGFGARLSAEPERTAAQEVAHHEPIGMPFADRAFVDATRFEAWSTSAGKLSAHILLIELLDAVPPQVQFRSDVRDCGPVTAPAYVGSKALGIQGAVGQPRKSLALHCGTRAARDPSPLELEVDPRRPPG